MLSKKNSRRLLFSVILITSCLLVPVLTQFSSTVRESAAESALAQEEAFDENPQRELAPWYDLYYYVRPELGVNAVPRRLPSEIPPNPKQIVSRNLFASILAGAEPADAPYYEIEFAVVAGCNGARHCHYATVAGYHRDRVDELDGVGVPERQLSVDFVNEDPSAFANRDPAEAGDVELANGITGTFIPWLITAYLTDAKIMWDEGPYRYLVAVKGASKEEMVRMANSAILNPDGVVEGHGEDNAPTN